MRKKYLLFMLSVLMVTGGQAQQTEHFTVATLNVDGLPQKILVFDVNADGPGAEGTSRIGKFLKQKSYDIVCMQEDFNFHDFLMPWMEDDYRVSDCSGRIGLDVKEANIDLRYPQNVKFPTDGLTLAHKNGITLTESRRARWSKSFGKFSHSVDDMVTKGFRRYELTLPKGNQIVVYNMHMDASSAIDEEAGRDSMDRDARLKQWIQLREDVLTRMDSRPVVLAGDMNTLYCRDRVKKEFIDVINASGKGTVEDVWVLYEKDGQYPEYTGGIVSTGDKTLYKGEALDKILFVNPTSGSQLKVESLKMDSTDYQHDGKRLGDHYPLVATFVMNDRKTAIEAVGNNAEQETATYYNMQGQRISAPEKGVYIERRGKNSIKRMK